MVDLPRPSPGECTDYPVNENSVHAELRGLPRTIVAGSGWHEFTYRATNISKRTLTQVNLDLTLGVVANQQVKDVDDLLLTTQWYDSTHNEWKKAPKELANWGLFAGARDLRAGEYVDARMRIRIESKAPSANGYFFTSGWSLGADGLCGTGTLSRWNFTTVPAGASAGPSAEASSQPVPASATAGAPQQLPAGNRVQLPVSGHLANTGSSSALPAIAWSGAGAVVFGAGAALFARRRGTRA